MKYITSITSKTKMLGVAPYSQCISCAEKSPLLVVETYGTPKVFYLPTIKLHCEYIAICTSCFAKYSVSRCKGKNLARDINALLLPKDLSFFTGRNPILSIDLKNYKKGT